VALETERKPYIDRGTFTHTYSALDGGRRAELSRVYGSNGFYVDLRFVLMPFTVLPSVLLLFLAFGFLLGGVSTAPLTPATM